YLYGAGGANVYQVVFTGAGAGATIIADSGGSPGTRLIAYGTPGDDTIVFTGTRATRGGERIDYSGLTDVTIEGRGGTDPFAAYTAPAHIFHALVDGTPSTNNTLYVIDTTPGALAVNIPSGPMAGVVKVCYFMGPDNVVAYQSVAHVITFPTAEQSYVQ